jgi:hypothetical protein
MLELSVNSDDPVGDLEDLADWLDHDPGLRGLIREGDSVPGDGQLGAVTDFLVAAVSSGGAISVLITALQSYFASRAPDLTITLRGPKGTVTIDAKRARDHEALIRAAREAVGIR